MRQRKRERVGASPYLAPSHFTSCIASAAFGSFLLLLGREMPYNGLHMKNRPVHSRFGRIVRVAKREGRRLGLMVLVLLAPVTMLNASQALTLCVRHDGRIAVEPVVEGRCPCETHASSPNPDGTAVVSTPDLAEMSCQSCTDLSIPPGLCLEPGRAKGFSPLRAAPPAGPAWGNHAGMPLPVALGVGETTPFESPPDRVSYPIPLDSIILRV